MRKIEVQGQTVALNRHATLRYLERVKHGLGGIRAAEDDLERMSACATIEATPEWAKKSTDVDRVTLAERFDTWMMIGEDVAFPLEQKSSGRYEAVTCIAKGALSDAARQARAEQRQRRSQIRHFQRTEGSRTRNGSFYKKRRDDDDYE